MHFLTSPPSRDVYTVGPITPPIPWLMDLQLPAWLGLLVARPISSSAIDALIALLSLHTLHAGHGREFSGSDGGDRTEDDEL